MPIHCQPRPLKRVTNPDPDRFPEGDFPRVQIVTKADRTMTITPITPAAKGPSHNPPKQHPRIIASLPKLVDPATIVAKLKKGGAK